MKRALRECGIGFILANTAAIAMAQPALVAVPGQSPDMRSYIVEQSDLRALADGSTARFLEQHRVRFGSILDDGSRQIDLQLLRRHCEGPPAICRQFERLASDWQQATASYRLSADGSIAALQPHRGGSGAGAADVLVRDALLQGGISAADGGGMLVVQMTRFAGLGLPAVGEARAFAGRRLVLESATTAFAMVRIEPSPESAGAPDSLVSLERCTISLSSGLMDSCVATETIRYGGGDIVRTRSLRVLSDSSAVQ